jgi:coenzyme F420-dependent glucose-6-phosphate dehydrogenase
MTLVKNAAAAEEIGFSFALASDHLLPWVPAQGQAPFVWAVLGAAAHATSRMMLGTGVSSPIHRIHPVVLAQAAATVAAMAPGRFVLGLGEGERINEHVTGEPWPRPGVRRRMVAEAVQIIRPLLAGEAVNHEGEFFTVEHAQLYTRPASPPQIWLAIAGPRTARLAAEQFDGMIGLAPQAAQVQAFEACGGMGKPVVGQLHLCLADSVAVAVATTRKWWAHQALPGALLPELSRPQHFAAAVELLHDSDLQDAIVCCNSPKAVIDAIAAFAGAGFTHVALHQVGPDQQRLFDMARDELLPAFSN